MQRLSRREQQQVTRERLKRSGTAALAWHGFQGARIDQVARDAGLTKGAFYAHFDDKLAMALEILADRQASEIAQWKAMLEAAADPAGCLDEVIRGSRESSRVNGLVGLELHLEAERNEAFRPHFVAYVDRLHDEVADLLVTVLRRNGKAAPPDLRTTVVEIYMLGLPMGAATVFGSQFEPGALTSELIRGRVRELIERSPLLPSGASVALPEHHERKTS